jgi:hypothetical protein
LTLCQIKCFVIWPFDLVSINEWNYIVCLKRKKWKWLLGTYYGDREMRIIIFFFFFFNLKLPKNSEILYLNGVSWQEYLLTQKLSTVANQFGWLNKIVTNLIILKNYLVPKHKIAIKLLTQSNTIFHPIQNTRHYVEINNRNLSKYNN